VKWLPQRGSRLETETRRIGQKAVGRMREGTNDPYRGSREQELKWGSREEAVAWIGERVLEMLGIEADGGNGEKEVMESKVEEKAIIPFIAS